MKWMLRRLRQLMIWIVVVVLALLSPVAYTELACAPDSAEAGYVAILPPKHHRPESRTLLTYPEWHIVHAYDDYARVISTGDPHDYGYVASIFQFWSSLCTLSQNTGQYGGFPTETKMMVYTIGVSFSAEFLAKAVYEETVGRVATWLRGSDQAGLDKVSAEQAQAYARFLQQVPWYKWDFQKANSELFAKQTDSFRDRERAFALGIENAVKTRYAKVIANAVGQVGQDALTLRMIVTGLSDAQLGGLTGVKVMAQRPQGTEIETPRYRELTNLLRQMAVLGAEFVEIAGNDDILFTSISPQAEAADFRFARQGYGDYRHLRMIKVTALAQALRDMSDGDMRLEHVHDY